MKVVRGNTVFLEMAECLPFTLPQVIILLEVLCKNTLSFLCRNLLYPRPACFIQCLSPPRAYIPLWKQLGHHQFLGSQSRSRLCLQGKRGADICPGHPQHHNSMSTASAGAPCLCWAKNGTGHPTHHDPTCKVDASALGWHPISTLRWSCSHCSHNILHLNPLSENTHDKIVFQEVRVKQDLLLNVLTSALLCKIQFKTRDNSMLLFLSRSLEHEQCGN